MKNIPSAHEFLLDQGLTLEQLEKLPYFDIGNLATWLEEFAIMHVEAFRKELLDNVKLSHTYGYGTPEDPGTTDTVKKDVFTNVNYGHGECTYNILKVDKDFIVNAYPEENIIK